MGRGGNGKRAGKRKDAVKARKGWHEGGFTG